MPRQPKTKDSATIRTAAEAATDAHPPVRLPSKLDRLVAILRREDGADMSTMIEATGWQVHSIRGAMAGALKKRGHAISSDKTGDRRVWRIAAPVEGAQ